jgi:hypothetical protein
VFAMPVWGAWLQWSWSHQADPADAMAVLVAIDASLRLPMCQLPRSVDPILRRLAQHGDGASIGKSRCQTAVPRLA